MAGKGSFYTEGPDGDMSTVGESSTLELFNPRKNLMDIEEFSSSNLTNVDVGQEHMKVYLRIRPFTSNELDRNENQGCLAVQDCHSVLANAPKDSHTYKNCVHGLGKTSYRYTFSRIFKDSTTQKEFFNDTMLNMVKDCIDGQNCLVFTYGVTSSGKTYTIQGEPSDAGILPRALDVLFNSINGKQWPTMNLKPKMFMDVEKLNPEQEAIEKLKKEKTFKMSSDDDLNVNTLLGDDATDMSQITNTTASSESSNTSFPKECGDNSEDMFADLVDRVREETVVNVEDQGQINFSVWVSFAEIYNEQIFDLLEPIPRKKTVRRPILKLSDDKNGSPYIKGLKEIQVNSADEAYRLLSIGQRNLSTACTKLNHQSSRSHCIFNIKILRVVDNGNPQHARVSMLSLCDLAGSERHSKTQSQGDRLKEASNINTSLLTLGRCIETLRFNQNHKEHPKIIPFRDSKLTRLFQNFFCGRGKAVMVVNVNQLASMFDETLCVFKFSAIAKQLVVVQKPAPRPKLFSSDEARPSISWDTPGTLKKMSSDMHTAQHLPLPDDTDELDETIYAKSDVEELIRLAQTLEEQLEKERQENLLLETRIREEVCKEMGQQLVQIEEACSERIRFREQMAEEMADERIKILTEAYEARSRKRPHMDKDCDDEMVSCLVLHQEKIKVQKKDEEITKLKLDMDTLKAQLKQLQESNDNLKKENVKIKNKQDEDASQAAEDLGNTVVLETLSKQLQDARDQIKDQEKEINDLNDMLTEAGETFQQKEEEIERMKNVILEDQEKFKNQEDALNDLQKTMEESQEAMVSAHERLTRKEKLVSELEIEVDKYKDEVKTLKTNHKFVEDIVGEKEKELLSLRNRLKREEEESTKRQQALIHGFKEEIETYKNQATQLKTQLMGTKTYEDSKKTVLNTSKHAVSPRKKNTNEMSGIEHFKHDLLRQVKALQTELDENTSGTVLLEQALVIARSATEDLEKRLAVEAQGHKNAQIQIEQLQRELELNKSVDTDDIVRQVRTHDLDVEDLIDSKDKEIKTLNDKINELVKSLTQKMVAENSEMDMIVASGDSSLQTVVGELRKDITSKEVVIEKLEQDVEEQRTLNAGLRDIINQTTLDTDSKKNPVNIENDSKEDIHSEPESINALQKLKEMRKKYEEVVGIVGEKQSDIDKLKIEIDELRLMCSEKDENLTMRMDDKYKDVEFQLEEKLIEFTNIEEQLKVSTDKIESIEKVKIDLENQQQHRDDIVKNLEQDIENKAALIKQQEEELKRILNENELLIEESKTKITTYKETVDTKNSQLKNMEGRIQELEEELVKSKNLLEDNVQKMKRLEQDLSSRDQGEAENMKEMKASLLKLELEFCTKEQELIECKNIAEETEVISESLRTRVNGYEQELRELRNSGGELGPRMAGMEESLLLKEKQVMELVDVTKKLENDMSLVKADFESKITKLQEVELSMQKELECKEEEINRLVLSLQDKNNETQRLRNELSELELKQSVGEKHSKDGINDLMDKVDILNGKIASLELDLDSKDNQAKEAMSHHEELKQQLSMKQSALEKVQNELSAKNNELQEFKETYKKMSEKLTENKEEKSSMSEANLQIAELKSTLHTYQVLHETTKQQLVVKSNELDNKAEELTLMTGQLNVKTVELNVKTEEMNVQEEKLNEKISELQKLNEEHGSLKQQYTKVSEELTENLKHLEMNKEKIDEMIRTEEEITVLKDKISSCQTTINELQKTAEEKDTHIERMQQKFNLEISEKNKTSEDMQKTLDSMMNKKEMNDREEISISESEITALKECLVEKEKFVVELERSVEKLTIELNSSRDIIAKNEKDILNLKKAQDSYSESDKTSANSRVSELEKCLVEEKAKCREYHDKLESVKLSDCLSPDNSVSSCARKLRKEKIEIENKLIEAKWTIENLEKKVKEQQNSEKELAEKSDGKQDLQKQLEMLNEAIAKKDENNRNCIRDIVHYQTRIEQLEKDLAETKASLGIAEKEMETLNVDVVPSSRQRASIASPSVQGELNRSQERENVLRNQLRNAHSMVQELNERVDLLEEKLKIKSSSLEKLGDDNRVLQGKLIDLEDNKRKETADMERNLTDTREELIRKDKKLQSKIATIKELRQTIELDQDKFTVALKDAKANEMVIENLKSILNEQEETMETQDKVLLARDEEIKTLHSDLTREREKSCQYIEASGSSGRELRDLYKCNAHLEAEKIHLTRNLQEKDALIQKMNLEKEKLQIDLDFSVKRITAEKDCTLMEKNAEIKKLSDEIGKSMSQQDELVEKLKVEKNTTSKEKDSLIEKLKDERDKLLHDKESVMKQLMNDNQKLLEDNKQLSDNLDNQKKESCSETSLNRTMEQRIAEQDEIIKKMANEKRQHDSVIKDNTKELKELEKSLLESRENCEQLRTEMEKEIKLQVNQLCRNLEETIHEQKIKLREREHKMKELQRELNSLSQTMEEKDREMNKWRDERDGLVFGLETVLKKQQKELKQLKEEKQSNWSEKQSHLPSEESNLPDSTEDFQLPPMKRPSSNRQSRKRTVSTASSDDHMETSRVSASRIETSFGVDDSDVTTHLQIDATPSVAAKTLKKSRKGKKVRSSIDALREEKTEKENSRPRRGAKSRASEKMKDVVAAIQSSPVTRSAKRVLGSISETISPSRDASASTSAISESSQDANESKGKAAKSKRRRHQLYKEELMISDPIDCVSFVPSSSGTEVHGIVKRQLRDRRH
ncbi:hypothetical protein ScPMuIL_008530 [Solemya velum]